MGALGAADICCAPHEMSLFGPRKLLTACSSMACAAGFSSVPLVLSILRFLHAACSAEALGAVLGGEGAPAPCLSSHQKDNGGRDPTETAKENTGKVRHRRWCPLQPASRRGLGPYSAVHETTAGLSPPCFQAPAQRTSTANFSKVRQAPRSAIV